MTARPVGPIRYLALLTAVLCGLTLVSCSSAGQRRTVTVLGPWTDAEEAAFQTVLDEFEREHPDITVKYNGSRDADTLLSSELGSGNQPDLAVLASPGEMRQFARKGILKPLDRAPGEPAPGGPVIDDSTLAGYAPDWRNLMRAPGPSKTKRYYAVVIKAAVKSLIWYDPDRSPEPLKKALSAADLTWSDLTEAVKNSKTGRLKDPKFPAGVRPWCLGLEDSSNSGWPATDWIEDLVLHQSGPEVYDKWVNGDQKWSSPEIKQAWQTWGGLLSGGLVYGDRSVWLGSSYGKAGAPMFGDPPGCYLEHAASFMAQFYAKDDLTEQDGRKRPPKEESDYTYVPFPRFGGQRQTNPPQEVAGDLLGMFRDTPEARILIKYLTTAAAQSIVVTRFNGAISANQQVASDIYPEGLLRRLGETFRNATQVRFDASDSMPPQMSRAFNQAVLAFVDDPERLAAILDRLDLVQDAAYPPEQ